MIILDLFSGIGGFSKGLLDAGIPIEHHYNSEIDKHAIANYKHNFKNSTHVGSVTDVHEWRIERPSIIAFGSPCQDFSLAGKRAGLEGDRSSLIRYSIEAVKRFRPHVFVWENVKGAFSSNNGADFWAILQAFADIGGYRLEWQLLNTSWFLPQNRERIYLVGHLDGRSESGVFPIGENDRLSDNQKRGAEGKGERLWSYDTQANCISTRYYKDGSENLIQVKSATTSGYEEADIGDSINFSVPNSETRRGRVGKGVAQTLDTQCNQGVLVMEAGQPQSGRVYNVNGLSPALNSGSEDSGTQAPKINSTTGIRRLTEIECERLQGFPDNWTKYGDYDGVVKEISKTQRYKMCGNAVTVDVVKAIGQRLKLK